MTVQCGTESALPLRHRLVLQAAIQTRSLRPSRMARSFDGHRLGEIARLVDVGPQDKRRVVRKKLQRQREDERRY